MKSDEEFPLYLFFSCILYSRICDLSGILGAALEILRRSRSMNDNEEPLEILESKIDTASEILKDVHNATNLC